MERLLKSFLAIGVGEYGISLRFFCISRMTNDVARLFTCFFVLQIAGAVSAQIFAHLKNWVVCCLLIELYEFFVQPRYQAFVE